MFDLVFEILLPLVGELLLASFTASGSSGPVSRPVVSSPAPRPRVLVDQTRTVEDGRIRLWRRHRSRRGDDVRMIEFRSNPSRLPVFKGEVDGHSLQGTLPPESETRIRRIAGLYSGRLFVESDGVSLVVRACGEPKGLDTLFHLECHRLLRELRSAAVTGRLARSSGLCPVCKVSTPADPACSLCRTPHHRDCWRYAGHCSVFGCGGRDLASAG